MLTLRESRDFPGARPLDHRMALAHLNGMTARQIGDDLGLTTDYVRRRLSAITDMPMEQPVISQPGPTTIPMRVLKLLEAADHQPVRTIDLISGAKLRGLNSLHLAVGRLRRLGHRIESRQHIYAMTSPPTKPIRPSSRAVLAIVERLGLGPATPNELARLASIKREQVGVYVVCCQRKGAIIEGAATYRLEKQESQS